VIVAPWTDLDNDEVFDLRIQLESHGASLAAQRRSESDIARLHALNAEMAGLIQQRSEDFRSDIQDINRRFHEAVVQAARSPRLVQMVGSLPSTRGGSPVAFFFIPTISHRGLEDQGHHAAIDGSHRACQDADGQPRPCHLGAAEIPAPGCRNCRGGVTKDHTRERVREVLSVYRG
jgi:DNA-binding GntR family transcriptional regulator